MSYSKFRWCFIGTGRLAQKIAKILQTSPTQEIVTCYSRSYEKAKAFAEEYGAKAYEDPLDAMTDPNVDGVYIVTTHNAHARFAKMAIKAKKPTLVEKSFTVCADETKELIELARQEDVLLCEAMWTWFAKGSKKVKSWVEEGRIGAVRSVSANFILIKDSYAQRVADKHRAGGALLDLTVYPLTYAYVLFGEPTSIKASAKLENGIDVHDYVDLVYPGFTFHIETGIDGEKRIQELDIRGEDGSIISDAYSYGGPAHLLDKEKEEIDRSVSLEEGTREVSYLAEFDAFALTAEEDKRECKEVPLAQTLRIMELMDEIREQIGLTYSELE